MIDAPALLHVCTACRTDQGAALHGRLKELLATRPDAPVRLLEARCLSNCEHGCSAAIAMPGKWSYLLGGLGLDLASDLLDYAAIYAVSKTGVVMPSKRPAALAAMVHGRIPPLATPETSQP